MADVVLTKYTTLAPEEVLVRAVQFFTNEKWRAQSQTNRVATFVGVPQIPWLQLLVALFLALFFIFPGLIYYLFVIRKLRRLQNLVVTATQTQAGSEVVVTYPSSAQRYVDNFFAALPDAALQQLAPNLQGGVPTSCGKCGKAIAKDAHFCTTCGTSQTLSSPALPPV